MGNWLTNLLVAGLYYQNYKYHNEGKVEGMRVYYMGKPTPQFVPYKDVIRIGTGEICDVRLPDDDLGYVHATIRRHGWNFKIEGSPNRWFYHNKKVTQKAVIHPGDWITINYYSFVDERGFGKAKILDEARLFAITCIIVWGFIAFMILRHIRMNGY